MRKRPSGLTIADHDGEGRQEALLRTKAVSLTADPAEGGTVTEWNLFGPHLNLLDTLSRRYEPYHEQLKARQPVASVPSGHAPASIHDVLGVKEHDLEAHVIYDDHRRSAFHDYALQRMPSLEQVVRSTWGEGRLWSSEPFRLGAGAGALSVAMVRDVAGGRIAKTVRVDATRPMGEFRYELEDLEVPVIVLEFNISLRDERYVRSAHAQASVTEFRMEEASSGVALELCIDPPTTLFRFPIETVSESEQGLERTYQGLCLMGFWELPPARSWSSRLQWVVRT